MALSADHRQLTEHSHRWIQSCEFQMEYVLKAFLRRIQSNLIWCNIVFGGRKVTEEKVKKSWAVVDAESHQRDDVKRETVYCLNDDDETEVQKDDTIQGAESISY